jgi:hypothetical protein
MSVLFREPYFPYEEPVRLATDFGAKELSALTTAIGLQPDERLWVDKGPVVMYTACGASASESPIGLWTANPRRRPWNG